MKRYLIIFVLLLCSAAVLYGQEPKDDPNVMWTYKWTNFSTYPAVHPNGNVIIGDGSNGDVIEINGLTGELVRRIKVPNPPDYREEIEISQDGTRLIVEDCLIDYASGEVIMSGLQRLQLTFLNPYNDKLIQNKEGVIRITDLNDNKYTDYDILSGSYTMTAMKVSNDGKYLAIAQRDYKDEYDWHTHFSLYDAQTMKLIRELEDVVSEARRIEFIQFSENSKYVGYSSNGGVPKATFFTCEPPYKKYEYNNDKEQIKGYSKVGFIGEDYVFLCSYPFQKSKSIIENITDSKIIYQTDFYSGVLPEYNKKYNSIITNYFYFTEFEQINFSLNSLSFDKILSGVGVDEPNNPIINLNVNYQNGLLRIMDYEVVSSNITLSISDISGKILYNQTVLASEQIEIPLNLNSGTYLINLQDGNNSFSDKFLVVE